MLVYFQETPTWRPPENSVNREDFSLELSLSFQGTDYLN